MKHGFIVWPVQILKDAELAPANAKITNTAIT
jgi:hypothetical protein